MKHDDTPTAPDADDTRPLTQRGRSRKLATLPSARVRVRVLRPFLDGHLTREPGKEFDLPRWRATALELSGHVKRL